MPSSFPRPPALWNNHDMLDPSDLLPFFCLWAQLGVEETALLVHPHHQWRRTLWSRESSHPCWNKIETQQEFVLRHCAIELKLQEFQCDIYLILVDNISGVTTNPAFEIILTRGGIRLNYHSGGARQKVHLKVVFWPHYHLPHSNCSIPYVLMNTIGESRLFRVEWW